MGTTLGETQNKVDILALNRIKVFDENGKEVFISSFWKERPVVLIFVRHFSCLGCRAHVDQIWKSREKFKKANTDIAFIGNGSPFAIKSFKEAVGAESAPVYTDPTLQSFDACGLSRGVLNLLNPRGVKSMVGLAMKGYKQGPFDSKSGSHTQMGGVVGLRPPGRVIYHFISDYVGDLDRPEDSLGAIVRP